MSVEGLRQELNYVSDFVTNVQNLDLANFASH